MRPIAVINQKGGVGKTTTTANLGAALARAGSRVLLVDLDPQGHLSLHFGAEPADGQPSIYDVLTSHTPLAEVTLRVGDNLSLVPADIDLAGAEMELVSITGREVLLREALVPAAQNHDYLLIDCPPSLGILTVNALVATDEVLIPLQAQFFALQGLSKLFETVTLVRQRINPKLEVVGVVLCMHEPLTRLATEVVADLTSFLESARQTPTPWSNAKVFDTCIRRNIKLAEASSFGQTVFDYAPRSNGAIDYANLAIEIFGDSARMAQPESALHRSPQRNDSHETDLKEQAPPEPSAPTPPLTLPANRSTPGVADTRSDSSAPTRLDKMANAS